LNRLALADSLKAQGSNAQEREVEPSSEDKVVVHELQIEDTKENNNVITISDGTRGQVKSLQLEQKPIDPVEQEESTKDSPMEHVYQDEEKEDAHNVDGGKGHDKLKSRRPKLSFEELLAKYEKIGEANIANRSKKVQSSKLPQKHNSQEWNWQGNGSYAATTYYPFEQPILMYYGPQPTYFHPYSPWGWFDEGTHLLSYDRPQYIEYATPRYSEKSSSYKDRFDQNRSGAQAKKKVVKQFYSVKYDDRKDKSSDLNSTIEKPITLLKNLANDGK
jgi:hypothetical protein